MDEYVKWYLDQLNSNPNTVMLSQYDSRYVYTADVGRVYTKIVQENVGPQGSSGRSVHAFMKNGTGEILKAAGWKAPAKGVRFVLPADNETVAARMGFSGGYLYK